jgi:6-phosphogluconate dehydrogenase
MVNARTPVDDVIQEVSPLLDEGDIIVDGGNSFFRTPNDGRKRATANRTGSSAFPVPF